MHSKLIQLLAVFVTVLLVFSACSKAPEETRPGASAQNTASSEAAPETGEPAGTSETAPDVPDTSEAASEPAPTEELTVTDMIGREVTVIPGSYRRVVCIGAGALRMFSYVADVSLLSGVEDIDNVSLENRPKMFDNVARPYVIAYGDVFSTLPSAGIGGPNAQTADAERILACTPDLVISEYEDIEKEDSLQEAIGVPVITLRSGPKGVFDDAFKSSLRLLGQLFRTEERAETLISFIENEEAEISRRTSGIAGGNPPSVYIAGLGNWGTTNHLMTSSDYYPFLVAHIENALSDGTPGIHPIEAEKFVSIGDSVDIMILDAAAVKNIKPLLEEDPALFDSCKAWREDNVYLEMAYNAYYTNYEIALANAWFIAKAAYPDSFDDLDMTAKTAEITEAFLGRDLTEEMFALTQSYGGYQKISTEIFFQ